MPHDYLEDHDRAPSRLRKAETERTDVAGLGERIGNRALANAVQRAGNKTQGAGPLDPEIAAEIDASRGGGSALDDDTRADMEGNLGVDLSGVRVHTDTKADSLARSVQAEAFTTGSDVFFKGGTYAPESTDGRRLLAHELTHVVQQSSGDVEGGGRVSHPDDAHEVEARAVGDAVAGSAPATGASVDREELEEEEMQMSVDREGEMEEEEMQMSVDREGEMEEEEVMMSVDRQEEEEEEVMA